MTLLAGVLLASLLGSVHCGAMCSAFACLANGGAQRGVWYHGGRLLAYVTLGVAAGVVGAGLDRAGLIANVQRTAALVTSVALIAWGLLQLRLAMRARRFAGASQWGGTLARLVSRTAAWDPRARAAAIGLTTALLPCGWLWAFIATAMGTGAPWRAAAVMSLVHSARLNGHDPYAYLKNVLERLPTQPASRVRELLPHRWQATITAS